MRIVCISDTHNRHNNLIIPDGDVLIHAGDITELGTEREVKRFLKWFTKQPHNCKIFIAGNHDYYLEKVDVEDFNKSLPENVHYLHNTGIETCDLKIWGTPQVPSMSNWAFNEPYYWNDIPEDTEVVISHVPPYDILDLHDRNIHLGDKNLEKKVKEIQPKLHIFGHVHDGYGLTRLNNTIFINASSQDTEGRYFNPPIIFDTTSKDLLSRKK